jgi:hypothetical protein
MIRNLSIITIALMITAAAFPGCRSGNNLPAEVPTSPGAAGNKPTPHTFEGDLQYVRNGQYTHIWVFSRKDGHPLDKDDATFLRTNATQVVDWVTTDEGKKVIAGTNFDLELGNLAILKKRFVVEDYTGK